MSDGPRGIGERVRVIRERRGLSQAELARKIGASAYGMNLLEQGGTHFPRADRIYALAKALDVSADVLLGITQYSESNGMATARD